MVSPEDCSNCLRILTRDGCAESAYQDCFYCHHVKIVNGKRILIEVLNANSSFKKAKEQVESVTEKDLDRELS